MGTRGTTSRRFALRGALVGATLATGAPLGWAAIDALLPAASHPDFVLFEPLLYGYLAVPTLVIFTVFGWYLGRQAERTEAAFQALEQSHRELERVSRTDVDTGLYNDRAFAELLVHLTAAARRNETPLALVVWDLDQYRGLVEHYGRACGREALAATAKYLLASERTEDLVARIGTEAFAAALPNTPIDGARVVAERLVHDLRTNGFRFDGQRHHLTLSAGYAELEPGDDGRSLLSRAEVGLYQAKRMGGNTAVGMGANAKAAKTAHGKHHA